MAGVAEVEAMTTLTALPRPYLIEQDWDAV